MPQVDGIDSPREFVKFVSEKGVEMRWKYKRDFVETNAQTNVIIAAHTNNQARIKLYSYLGTLGTN